MLITRFPWSIRLGDAIQLVYMLAFGSADRMRFSLILRGKLRKEVKMTSYDFRWMANYTVIREKMRALDGVTANQNFQAVFGEAVLTRVVNETTFIYTTHRCAFV
jgi:hypothetical protein